MRVGGDLARPLAEQPGAGHNRWHPDLEPVAAVRPGEAFTIAARDGFDGQLGPASTDADVATLSTGRSHPLVGPVAVEGAQPGDLLELEIVECRAASFGFTVVLPGVGVLADRFDAPRFVPWEVGPELARSSLLPGVAVPVRAFPGIVGVAPSHDLVERARAREHRLAATGALVLEPDAEDAVPGHAADGLRTIPPREHGGNLDVRQLTAGSRLLLAVERPGALVSAGDLHAAQGDGECCGSAIEVAGTVMLRAHLHRDPAWRPRFPCVVTPPESPGPAFATTGIPLTDDGENGALDLGLATRRALGEMVDLLAGALGVEPYLAYALCSAAADLRISEAVDAPNAIVSVHLPVAVFDDPPWPFSLAAR